LINDLALAYSDTCKHQHASCLSQPQVHLSSIALHTQTDR
jgi:hypothetical protein